VSGNRERFQSRSDPVSTMDGVRVPTSGQDIVPLALLIRAPATVREHSSKRIR
jgi:hypothetical protein